jgi:hypothetical protein
MEEIMRKQKEQLEEIMRIMDEKEDAEYFTLLEKLEVCGLLTFFISRNLMLSILNNLSLLILTIFRIYAKNKKKRFF